MVTNAKLIYITLRCICIMYLLPIGYVAALFTYRGWFRGQEQTWELVFLRSGDITAHLWIFAICWFCVSVTMLIRTFFEYLGWSIMLADNIPEDDPVIVRAFHKACDGLHIRADKLAINRNVKAKSPFIIGIIHPQIILPEKDYTEQDLEMIFFHELSHYKHRDLIYKGMVVLIKTVHFFNPVVYMLLARVNLWSEYMADVSALEASGNLYNAKPYFDNIVKLIPGGSDQDKAAGVISTLAKNDDILQRRVDFMTKYLKVKAAGKVVTAALAGAFILLSASTAYASGKTVADLHNIVYQSTEKRTNFTDNIVADNVDTGSVAASDVNTLEEHYITIDDLNQGDVKTIYPPEDDIMSITAGVMYNFDWNVESNTRHVSGEYYIKAGQKVSVYAYVTPTTKDFWLGIMKPGSAWYVEGKRSASHTFTVSSSGYYRVFVQNNYKDGTNLHAVGNYIYDN